MGREQGQPTELKIARPHPEMPANLESAYAKAGFITKAYALNPETFIGKKGFPKEMVERDLADLESRQADYERLETNEYRLAKSFEAALFERINVSRWFGDRARMIMCSEFDDDENYIDGVLELQDGEGEMSHVGLGIDVTYSHGPGEKFEGIKREIDSGNLSHVKYFRSSDGSYEDTLKYLPRAVVVLDAADATRVVRDWDQNLPDAESGYRKIILRQLELQLQAYQAYARQIEKADKRRFVISRFYQRAKNNISALLTEIAKPDEIIKLDNHPSVQIIINQLKQFGYQENQLAQAA